MHTLYTNYQLSARKNRQTTYTYRERQTSLNEKIIAFNFNLLDLGIAAKFKKVHPSGNGRTSCRMWLSDHMSN